MSRLRRSPRRVGQHLLRHYGISAVRLSPDCRHVACAAGRTSLVGVGETIAASVLVSEIVHSWRPELLPFSGRSCSCPPTDYQAESPLRWYPCRP